MANWIFQSTPITQTPLTRTVFRFPSEFELPLDRTKKNQNIINNVYGTLWKLSKFIPRKKNQSALIVKISSHKTQKNRRSAKINSCKNFVSQGKLNLGAFSGLIERKTWYCVSWRIRMHKRFREIAHNDRSKISSNYVFEYGFYYKLLHLWSTFESFITFFIKSSAALGFIIITFVSSY